MDLQKYLKMYLDTSTLPLQKLYFLKYLQFLFAEKIMFLSVFQDKCPEDKNLE